jgi:hypothetical protein
LIGVPARPNIKTKLVLDEIPSLLQGTYVDALIFYHQLVQANGIIVALFARLVSLSL